MVAKEQKRGKDTVKCPNLDKLCKKKITIILNRLEPISELKHVVIRDTRINRSVSEPLSV